MPPNGSQNMPDSSPTAYFHFVHQVMQRYAFPDNTNEEIILTLSSLERRLNDKRLYLAVVGEFSSGKSTCINAVLGITFLATHANPTTAFATYLYYHPQLTLRVKLTEHQGWLDGFDAVKRYFLSLQRGGHVLDALDDDEFLNVLTADKDNGFASLIDELWIGYPSTFLQSGVIVIDTPGTNPGGKFSEKHSAITQRIVQQEADTALILIPGMRQTQTLHRFLEDYVDAYLSRCLFVMSCLHQIVSEHNSSRQNQEVLDDAQQQTLSFLEGLQVKSPTLLRFPILSNDEALSFWSRMTQVFQRSKQSRIQHEINVIRKTILVALQRERQTHITQTATRLSQMLDQRLNGALQAQQEAFVEKRQSQAAQLAAFRKRESQITQEAIPDIDAFQAEQAAQAVKRVAGARDETVRNIETKLIIYHNIISREVTQALNDAKTLGALDSVGKERIPTIFTQQIAHLKDDLQQMMHAYAIRIIEIRDEFDARWKIQFRRLIVAAGLRDRDEEGLTRLKDQQIITSERSAFGEIDLGGDARVVATFALSGLGAFLGTILIPVPVFGTIIGAIVGAMLSSLIPLSNTKRAQVQKELDQRIAAYFAEMLAIATKAFTENSERAESSLITLITVHVDRYRQQYQEILRQQTEELATLQAQQRAVQSESAQIARLQNEIAADLQQLEYYRAHVG